MCVFDDLLDGPELNSGIQILFEPNFLLISDDCQ